MLQEADPTQCWIREGDTPATLHQMQQNVRYWLEKFGFLFKIVPSFGVKTSKVSESLVTVGIAYFIVLIQSPRQGNRKISPMGVPFEGMTLQIKATEIQRNQSEDR